MILAIDQGTTGTTCLVFDRDGRIRGRAYSEFRQHFPRPGWVEHDATEIWDVTKRVASHALADAKGDPASLDAIGITNQRETVVAWDPETGEPVHNALVWQDRRTAARCDELRDAGHEPLVRERTGLCSTRTSRGPRSSGCCATSTRPARRCSARSTPGSCSSSRAATPRISPTPRARCCSTSASCGGTSELCELLGVDPGRLPEPLPSAHAYGTTSEFGGEVSRRRDRRRPAGGALRPGVPGRWDGEEHVRDRQLRAAQRRPRRCPSRATGC